MWVIANFIQENNVEVVPHSWMKGDECFWPTLPRDKIKKYIEKELEPDGSEVWKTYKARVIGKPYDDLQKARQKSNVALVRSDIETDVENKKRTVKKNKRYNVSEESSLTSEPAEVEDLSSDSEQDVSTSKFKKSLWPLSKNKRNQIESPLKVPEGLPPQQPRRSPRKVAATTTGTKDLTPTSQKSKKPEVFLEELFRPSGSCSSSTKTGMSNFESISIRNQNVMKTYLRTILEDVASMKEKLDVIFQNPSTRGGEIIEESDFLNELPVKTLDCLLALEETLKDKAKEAELANFLTRLGGANVGDSCRRALRASLMDEVACQYSWAGQKGKRVFSALHLKTAVLRAVLKQFPNAKEKEIETVIKDWLRPSRNRLVSREKSRKRGHEEADGNGDGARDGV